MKVMNPEQASLAGMSQSSGSFNSRIRKFWPYLLILPSFGLLLLFTFYPLLQGFWMSVFQRGVVVLPQVASTHPKFVGIDNFIQVFTDPEFQHVLLRTVVFVVFAVPLNLTIALVMALLLAPQMRGFGLARTIVFFPSMISLLTIGIMWKWLFGYNSGLINYVLSLIDISPVPWLQQETMAQIAVVIVWVWASAGFNMMILLAGLTAIPEDLYEASRIDGTSRWRTFWRITLPLLQPSVVVVVVLSSIEAFKVYELVLSLTGGGPGRATVYLIQTIYENAFMQPATAGVAAAQSVVLFVILFALSVIQLRLSRSFK
ncbi:MULTISPECIES: carbohydrate ABC transporter permease [Musicola]|uniref:Binding-protein-dependent transport systems inner membrane component n=1 Tax=Musicola paradisiaca (strain Ech703) TaxID=579405 RepID=C6C6G8_MUSP7|nr:MULTISPECIES: sugar ABC transporter permease [Musicola]ACS83887.1 binding-protein-dependent transport systems inner membrane component [Musicola paradisiaca Ech703]